MPDNIFECDFSEEKLISLLPNAKNHKKWFNELKTLLPQFEINTTKRLAAFISQTSYESIGYTVFKENLNYNANTLLTIWNNKFTPESAQAYSRKQEAIANRVYANRMGNGNEESGDGWKYRGRGLIQITGKDAYNKFASYIGMDLDDTIDYLETTHGVIHVSCWLWKNMNLNDFVDANDMVSLIQRLTHGLIDVDKRIEEYNKMINIIG
jgi:putative chitinase